MPQAPLAGRAHQRKLEYRRKYRYLYRFWRRSQNANRNAGVAVCIKSATNRCKCCCCSIGFCLTVPQGLTSDSSLAGRRLNHAPPSQGIRFQRAAGLVSAWTVSLTASCKPQLRSTVLASALTSFTELPKPVRSTCTHSINVILPLLKLHVKPTVLNIRQGMYNTKWHCQKQHGNCHKE